METSTRPRGRPARHGLGPLESRDRLVRRGLELLTQRGFAALSVDTVTRDTGVPKGSFYHHFASKTAFVWAVLEAYDAFLSGLLARFLEDRALPPLARLDAYVAQACQGLARFSFTRGCLVGNLGQDVNDLPDDLRQRLEACLQGWEAQVARCLEEARTAGDVRASADPEALSRAFWIGWEGAILRARLQRSDAPLRAFATCFRSLLQ